MVAQGFARPCRTYSGPRRRLPVAGRGDRHNPSRRSVDRSGHGRPPKGLGETPGTDGTACQRHVGSHQGSLPLFGNDGSFPAGTASGCYVPHLPTSACRFFAFRFVSDFRRRQPIATIQEIFTDRSSETKWPLGSKRNAPLKRAGKPPEGSRRNLRDTGGEKKCQEVRHGQRQKNLRATWRAPVLHAEFPHPFCGSGPADRGVDQGVRFYRSRPVRRGQHHCCRGTTVCDGPGRGNRATPAQSWTYPDRCRDAGG